MTTGYKLFRMRRDGTLGPLFIDKGLVVPLNRWLTAKCHPTPGYAVRPGWHVAQSPSAPHLKMDGRLWFKVEVRDYYEFKRPAHQGGVWLIAKKMRVLHLVNEKNENN